MKSMKFVFAALLVLHFLSGGLIAQTVNKTYSFITNFQVRCDGLVIDILRGEVTYQQMTHYDVNGKIDWFKTHMDGFDMVSLKTGETFKIASYQQKQDGPGWLEPIVIVSFHFNCVGDMGSHYLVSQIMQSDFTNVVPPNQPVNTYLKQECKCW